MKTKIFFLMLVIFALASSLTLAADPTGATTTVGSSETAAPSDTTQVNATGGNVTEVNITANAITTNWAGFWGSITGTLKLGDTSNTFYEWTVSDMDGAVVYAANETVSDWTLGIAGNSDMPAYVAGTDTDNFTNTFNETQVNPTLLGAQVTGSVPYALTWQSGSRGTLRTYALTADSGSSIVFAGVASNDATGFNTETLDYQIIAPAPDGSNLEYSFYLELP